MFLLYIGWLSCKIKICVVPWLRTVHAESVRQVVAKAELLDTPFQPGADVIARPVTWMLYLSHRLFQATFIFYTGFVITHRHLETYSNKYAANGVKKTVIRRKKSVYSRCRPFRVGYDVSSIGRRRRRL